MSFDVDALTDALMTDEGHRGQPYKDSVDVLTIGFGHNLQAKPLTPAQSARILQDDIHDTLNDLDRRLGWWRDLDPVRQCVLANMCFNLGVVRLCGFVRMLAACKAGLYGNAADEMLNSLWARQTGARAHRLAKEMRTGRTT